MAGPDRPSPPIAVGQCAERTFIIDAGAMAAFATLSGDRSAIHTDAAFARGRGYEDVIVYGGLMLAQLSGLLGSVLPGDDAVSARWSIDYRKPLYLGEEAVLRLEVSHVSPAVGLVELRFSIQTGDRLIATGSAQSLVPPDRIAP